MEQQIKMVSEFHQKFKQSQSDAPALLSNKESLLRYVLGKEELDEYIEAVNQEDMVEILDSLADQLYILFGTVCKHGLQDHIGYAFDLVHQNNMSKLGPDGNPILRADGKILKPVGFKKVNLKDILKL
jgi:predicted HAD superfamily Cof-like phosphohydrolase